MFWIRYTDALGATTERALEPAPTAIDYPEASLYKVLPTQDGSIVVQRPLHDACPRKWIWNGFGQPDASFVSQWTVVKACEYRARIRAALSPTIEIWEDSTGAGGFDRLDALGAKVWTKVKLLQVTRKPSGPGPLRFESSVTFYVSDPDYDQY